MIDETNIAWVEDIMQRNIEMINNYPKKNKLSSISSDNKYSAYFISRFKSEFIFLEFQSNLNSIIEKGKPIRDNLFYFKYDLKLKEVYKVKLTSLLAKF